MTTSTLESQRTPPETADVALAAAGDRRAFERLYRAHVARVHSLARRLIGTDDADEATQDVFVRAWEKLGTFRGDAAFGTWLHRLGVRVMLTRLRQRSTLRQRFVESDTDLERARSRGDRADLRLDFEAAVERLPAGAREVFVLYDVEGYKHEEIGELLGIAPGTSKSQLHRARMILREALD